MKKIIISLAAIAMMVGFSGKVMAQATSDAAITTATIIAPIGITKTGDLSFGNVAVTNVAGTVVLTSEGTRTATGGVTLPTGGFMGTVSAASFKVTGSGVSTYSITLPSTFDISFGTHVMTVNTFTSTPSGTGTLVAGEQIIHVGATLNVSGSQTPGTYTNTADLKVTVNYN